MAVDANKKKYFIFQEGDDIMFVINVPQDQIDDHTLASFRIEIESRGLDSIIYSHAESLIRNAEQGDVVKIGGIHIAEEQAAEAEEEVEEEEVIDPENLPFSIKVTPDGLMAELEIIDRNAEISEKHIEVALEYTGIKFGTEENIQSALVEKWPEFISLEIARGIAPVHGENASLTLVKDFKENLRPAIKEDGVVDFKQLDLISPIEEGDVLQVRIPPTPGIPGTTVFGKEIAAVPGKNLKLSKGENTEEIEDSTKLVSTREGFLSMGPSGQINVRPVYIVNSDVDYSTGNVKYKSDVLVKGDVRSGFSVKAGGDVHIYGAVEDASIEAGGNVIINGGVLASGNAVINAGGDVSIGFIQNGAIDAEGSIYIRIESISSSLKAGGDIEVTRAQGRIVGGDIEVGGWVVAQVIGSENGPVQKIRFRPSGGIGAEPDDRYRYCFVSTRELISPVRVIFGSLVASQSGLEHPVTISMLDNNIAVEHVFMGPENLKKLRRERLQKTEDEENQ